MKYVRYILGDTSNSLNLCIMRVFKVVPWPALMFIVPVVSLLRFTVMVRTLKDMINSAAATITAYFRLRLLQEIQDAIPLTYVYTDPRGYAPLARIDGLTDPEIFWYHCHPNGTPERLTDEEGTILAANYI